MYYYPNNLKARPLIWLWYLRDLTIISLGCIVAILMLISYFMVVPLVAVVVYGVLTMRIDDTSILDFITQACVFFILSQQTFYWEKEKEYIERKAEVNG